MIEISVIFLRLPDKRLVFQRRGKGAPTSPNLLGLFGGHVEDSETPENAAQRELAEETSLDVAKLNIVKLGDKTIEYNDGGRRHFFYFSADIENEAFDVFEGDRAESYDSSEALKRQDLTVSTRWGLKEFFK